MKRCVNNCHLNKEKTHCAGCLRSIEEIKAAFKKFLDN